MSARTIGGALVVLALVALHYTLRPILEWRAGVDFLIIAVLVIAVRARPGTAALAGFAIGLVSDALTPDAFGAGALAMTLVGYTASRMKATFYTDNVLLNALFVFVGKVTFDAIFLVAERRLHGLALLGQLLLWTPLAALVTALVGLAVMAMVRPTMDRRRP